MISYQDKFCHSFFLICFCLVFSSFLLSFSPSRCPVIHILFLFVPLESHDSSFSFNILTYGINEIARKRSHLKPSSSKYVYHIFSYLASNFYVFCMILTVTTDNNLWSCYKVNVYNGDTLCFYEVLNEILHTSWRNLFGTNFWLYVWYARKKFNNVFAHFLLKFPFIRESAAECTRSLGNMS
jgi:hypothetical protein